MKCYNIQHVFFNTYLSNTHVQQVPGHSNGQGKQKSRACGGYILEEKKHIINNTYLKSFNILEYGKCYGKAKQSEGGEKFSCVWECCHFKWDGQAAALRK